jgi:hypothetical protein
MKNKVMLQALAALLVVAALALAWKLTHRPSSRTAEQAREAAQMGRPPTNVTWEEPKTSPPPVKQPPSPNVVPAPSAKERFAKQVPFKQTQALQYGWTYGQSGDSMVFRDGRTGLIWGPRFVATVPAVQLPHVKTGMEACAAFPPEGAWALPRADEFDRAKADGLLHADADAAHNWLTYIADTRPFVLPAVRLWKTGEKTISVRCVGRDKP